MANSPNPDFISEVMERDFGTKVLITNASADRYLKMSRKSKESHEKWLKNPDFTEYLTE